MLPVQLAALKMNPDFLNRDVNANFSGGEKKRNEILQLSVLEVSLFSLTSLWRLVTCCGWDQCIANTLYLLRVHRR